MVEGHDALNLLVVLIREGDVERLDVCVQVLGLTPAKDGENIRRLLQDVRDCHFAEVRFKSEARSA